MAVPEHESRPDTVADLPLVTEPATVTEVVSMDRDRREEARAAIARDLEAAGLDGEYPFDADPSTWDDLRDALMCDGHHDLAQQVDALFARCTRPRPMLVRASFAVDDEFDYLAGQYVGFKYNGTSRAYSLASSPTQDELELCVRRVPDGRLSPQICNDLEPGDDVCVRGPYGELVLDEPSTNDMVFLATGTGVAPLKGMIQCAFDTGQDVFEGVERDVWLFLGCAWEDDLPYREFFRDLDAEHENFHFVPCLSREPYLTDWDGETDYVQHALLKHVDADTITRTDEFVHEWVSREPDSDIEARIDPRATDVYACGVSAMVFSLTDVVERIGVPDDCIEAEGFG
ncbi:ferredoxin--NADP reductase [Halospeciosus flavus]|uniref:Ferredoxin--NADP reductase n=1 Tax=Halospeciosus flavus TaxID=3032283 RepID=A0ABD5Z5E7_9EURY|nr:FAD-binding oxidoreductase [Halospeciosus flavus]